MDSMKPSTPEWWSDPVGGIVHDTHAPSMRPAIRDMWVTALRTGAYPQGFGGALRSADNEFCPLGLLCDLAAMVGVCQWEKVDGLWFIPPTTMSGTVAPPVRQWAGFKNMHPAQLVPLKYRDVWHPIWRLNDTYRLSFDTIADLIEEQYA